MEADSFTLQGIINIYLTKNHLYSLLFLAPTGALEDRMMLSVFACVRDIMLRMALQEFLKHCIELRGVIQTLHFHLIRKHLIRFVSRSRSSVTNGQTRQINILT